MVKHLSFQYPENNFSSSVITCAEESADGKIHIQIKQPSGIPITAELIINPRKIRELIIKRKGGQEEKVCIAYKY